MRMTILLIALFMSGPTFAELEYHSERLKMMDIETLQQIISKNLKKLENKQEAPEPPLKESLEILLAQPDQSLAASNIFDQLRSQVGNEKVFLNVLDEMISEALGSLNKKEKTAEVLREQSTYVYILNNMLAELTNYKAQEFYRQLIEKIRDADVDFSDALVTHRLLNSMSKIENPSQYAEKIVGKRKAWWRFW